jgi:hypothetical protein
MFENRVLRRIFGPKTDEVTGEWKKLHKEELYNLNSSPNIIRQIRLRRMMGGACGTQGGETKLYKAFFGIPKERDHLEDKGVDGRMGSEWVLGRLAGGMEWIQLAQDRDRWRYLVNTV